jgi:hypothetical protein
VLIFDREIEHYSKDSINSLIIRYMFEFGPDRLNMISNFKEEYHSIIDRVFMGLYQEGVLKWSEECKFHFKDRDSDLGGLRNLLYNKEYLHVLRVFPVLNPEEREYICHHAKINISELDDLSRNLLVIELSKEKVFDQSIDGYGVELQELLKEEVFF